MQKSEKHKKESRASLKKKVRFKNRTIFFISLKIF